MKTMYKVEERVYTDCEGKYTDWQGYGYVATIEEAKAIATTIKKTSNWDTGDWRIIARTMDEEAFAVEDIIVENYDWWKEVGRYDNARKNVEYHTKAIAKLEADKARCTTANGVARKDKDIAYHRAELARAEDILTKKR